MVQATSIDAPEARVFAITNAGFAGSLDIPEARVLAVYNRPADDIKSSEARVFVTVSQASDIEVTQARVLVIAKGRVAYPTIRVWTFTLDGHDYYVLRLGTRETLVYDVASKQWYVWGSSTGPLWYVYNGTNWLGGNRFASGYGSNVVVGDDGNGALYFLDPEYDFDDDSQEGADNLHTFERIAQGQVVHKGYGKEPCYGVELLGSIGDMSASTLTSVQLEFSDDRGSSYVDAGTLDVTSGELDTRLHWRSLGSITAPGRLFRVTDYGALRRIDSLDMNDGQ